MIRRNDIQVKPQEISNEEEQLQGEIQIDLVQATFDDSEHILTKEKAGLNFENLGFLLFKHSLVHFSK